MNVFNKSLVFLFSIALVASFSSCKEEETDTLPTPQVVNPIALDCEIVAEGTTVTLKDLGLDVDYTLDCSGRVRGDLIIEPGVTIQFSSEGALSVYGSLNAVGNDSMPITFTGEDKVAGSWGYIYIGTDDVKNKMEYCIVEYGGAFAVSSNGDKGNIVLTSDARLELNNSTLRHSAEFGIKLVYSGCKLPNFQDNTITDCKVPIIALPNYVNDILGGIYTGNELDAIQVASGFINIDATYRDLGVPYHALARLVVSAGGGKLTINPGVVLEFGLGGSLEIPEGASGSKPSLVAVGTEGNPILFTGIDKVEGAWDGIWFDSPSVLNEIGFATIEYASNADQSGAIYMWYGTVLNVHDVLFKDISNCAIQEFISAGESSTLTSSNLSYENVGNELCQN